MSVMAVAALSARVMAESAAEGGFDVIALDLFGDADTKRASSQWLSIGEPVGLRIAAARVLAALQALARRGDVIGWVAGGGFEAHPEVLEQGAAALPLLGTAPQAVRRVREPAEFFGTLAALGIPHPEVRWRRPTDTTGWLLKDARGCGGWHIRSASAQSAEAAPRHHYFQREMAGTPMSATFIANGHNACLLGFNELIVRHRGTRPFVYCGVVGPVLLPPGVASRLMAALSALAAEFSLRGLGSLDFMLDGDRLGVLEINPRPPASLFLYGRCVDDGVMRAHVNACLRGELPLRVAQPPAAVSGSEVVFARRSMTLDAQAVLGLAARRGVHDLPGAATAFEAGDPVCSVSASGAHANHVKQQLEAARDALLQQLETTT
jgi:predicted ATP-grasp superfamily ATP-dependent carboligase